MPDVSLTPTGETSVTPDDGSDQLSFSEIMQLIQTAGSVTLQGIGTVVGLDQQGRATLSTGGQTQLQPGATYTAASAWLTPGTILGGAALLLGLLVLAVRR